MTADAGSGSSRQRSTSRIRFAACETVEIADDEVGQLHGKGRRPEGVELLLHPRDGLRGVVLPKQLVVEPECAGGFVHAAEKRRPPAIRQGDHAGLPVNQPEDVIRQHTNGEPAGPQAVVEATEAGAAPRRRALPAATRTTRAAWPPSPPRATSTSARERCELHTTRTPPSMLLDGFARDLQNRRGKVAGDAVVAPRALQPGVQETGIERTAARRVSFEQGYPSLSVAPCSRPDVGKPACSVRPARPSTVSV